MTQNTGIGSGSTVSTNNITVRANSDTTADSGLLGIIHDFIKNRLQAKISLGVEASMMMRLLSLPASFFRRYSPGELHNRSSSGRRCIYFGNSQCVCFFEILLKFSFCGSLYGLIWMP